MVDLKNHPVLLAIDAVFRGAHNMFNKSPKRQAAWGLFARNHGVKKEFPLFNYTRWFSRMECLVVLTDNLFPFLLFLIDMETKDWASPLLRRLKVQYLIATLFMLRDMLLPFELLSKALQADSLLPYQVSHEVAKAKECLKFFTGDDWLQPTSAAFKRRAPLLAQFLSECKEGVWTRGQYNIELSQQHWREPWLRGRAKKIATEMIKGLDERFGDLELLTAFKIFDPASYAGYEEDNVPTLFTDEWKCLKDHFTESSPMGSFFEELRKLDDESVSGKEMKERFLGELDKEFEALKVAVWVEQDLSSNIPFRACMRKIFNDPANMLQMPHMHKLLYVCLALAMQTAVVERGFSLHRVFKDRLSHRLRLFIIDSLLRVKMLVPKGRAPHAFMKFEGICEKAASVMGKTFPQNPSPPLIVCKLNEEVNGVVLKMLSCLGDGVDVEDGDAEGGDEMLSDAEVNALNMELDALEADVLKIIN